MSFFVKSIELLSLKQMLLEQILFEQTLIQKGIKTSFIKTLINWNTSDWNCCHKIGVFRANFIAQIYQELVRTAQEQVSLCQMLLHQALSK